MIRKSLELCFAMTRGRCPMDIPPLVPSPQALMTARCGAEIIFDPEKLPDMVRCSHVSWMHSFMDILQ